MDRKAVLVFAEFVENHQLIKKGTQCWLAAASIFYAGLYVLILPTIFFYQRPLFIKALLIPLGTVLIVTMLRKVIARPRPYETLPITPLTTHSGEPSFPSRHTACAVVISCTVLQIHFTAGVILLFLALITGLSRVIAGLHYPTDIAAAFGVSLLVQAFYYL